MELEQAWMKIYMTLSIRMKQPVHKIAIFSLLTLLLNLREFQFLSHMYQQGLQIGFS